MDQGLIFLDKNHQENNIFSGVLPHRDVLSSPLLQKTINEKEDVRSHLYEIHKGSSNQDHDSDVENIVVLAKTRPESGILPPVVPYKSFSNKNLMKISPLGTPETIRIKNNNRTHGSPRKKVSEKSHSHRKTLLHRSSTVGSADHGLNGDNNVHNGTNGKVIEAAASTASVSSSSIYHEQVLSDFSYLYVTCF